MGLQCQLCMSELNVLSFNSGLTMQEPSAFHGSGAGEGQTEAPNCSKTQDQDHPDQEDASAIEQDSTYLEPTQKLSEVKGLALFPD